MGLADKVRNKTEELAGKAKQEIGERRHDEHMVAEGLQQEKAAQAKQAGEHVKDAGRDVRDAFS